MDAEIAVAVPLAEAWAFTTPCTPTLSAIDQRAIEQAAIALYPNASPATRNRQVYTPMSAILRGAGVTTALKRPRIDIGRSFALTEFRLSRLPNVRLISLQKGEGVEQLREMPEGMVVETLGDDYDAGAEAFLDTAAVMESLDLVISSDTSVAHLAGALGRPVWVALKYVPDWRWMLDRMESPWYPTMRHFRQRTMDDWKGVFLEIESALRELMGDQPQPANEYAQKASTPRVPISWGELIDKITILEIKSVEMVNEIARANVVKELSFRISAGEGAEPRPGGRGSVVDPAHPRLFGEFLDSAIDRLLEGVDLMLPHKLHEFATSVRGTVNMEDVPREFLSISLNDHGKELS